MDLLPTEVLHLICIQLQSLSENNQFGFSSVDVANLRLVNRSIARVASQYLIRGVRFHTSHQSLERLQQISNHPIFCRSIKVLLYYAAVLEEYQCQITWAGRHETQLYYETRRGPPPNATERERRKHSQHKAKVIRTIAARFAKYHHFYKLQQSLLHNNVLEYVLAGCVPKFCQLEHIEVTQHPKYSQLHSTRRSEDFGFEDPIRSATKSSNANKQLRYVLLPNGSINGNLRKLEVDSLSPSFFQVDLRSGLQKLFANLTHIKISLLLFHDDVAEAERCEDSFARHLANKVLSDALSVAQELQNLSIELDRSVNVFADLATILPDVIWDQLDSLNLAGLSSTQAAFLNLLKNQPNLKELCVANVQLMEGSWPNLLQQMREQLQLKTFVPTKFLLDRENEWVMDFVNSQLYVEEDWQYEVSDALYTYVTTRYPGYVVPNPLLDDYGDFDDATYLYETYCWSESEERDEMEL